MKGSTQALVLSLSHSDPTGGSGIQADIETVASLGAYCTPIITATIPYSKSTTITPRFTPADSVIQQLHAVIDDLDIKTIKVGQIKDLSIVKALIEILNKKPDIQVVLNPHNVPTHNDRDFYQSAFSLLAPNTDVLCISSQLLRALCPSNNLDSCAQKLSQMGFNLVLVTGTHEITPVIINSLYRDGELLDTFSWERLQNYFHGAGDTLSAAIAAILAHDTDPYFAVQDAQQYTWECLTHSHDLGIGMKFPNRLFWANDEVHEHNVTLN